jgi:hypothetical protein
MCAQELRIHLAIPRVQQLAQHLDALGLLLGKIAALTDIIAEIK